MISWAAKFHFVYLAADLQLCPELLLLTERCWSIFFVESLLSEAAKRKKSQDQKADMSLPAALSKSKTSLPSSLKGTRNNYRHQCEHLLALSWQVAQEDALGGWRHTTIPAMRWSQRVLWPFGQWKAPLFTSLSSSGDNVDTKKWTHNTCGFSEHTKTPKGSK